MTFFHFGFFCHHMSVMDFVVLGAWWNVHIKFHENPSSGSRVIPCGQTNMTKLIVAFRNFANPPDNSIPKVLPAFGCYSGDGASSRKRNALL
jgi:hypothetical protein